MTSPNSLTLCQKMEDTSHLVTIIGKIMGEGNIGNRHETQIKNVLYVDGLKHNLLSISQPCDKVFKIEFNKNCCLISEAISDKGVHIGKIIGNIYMLNIEHASFHELSCLVIKIDDS